ncbi:MAG: hypothetical protein ACI9HE_003706, partial [Planctomycetota bacterium]
HSGELASLTVMGKAFSTDFAPLDMLDTGGYSPNAEEQDHMTRLAFHFWTRGFPEVINFGAKESTRFLHGADGTLFYYQKGFRSGYFQIEPGQHVNADNNSKTNPLPSLFIMTRGSVMALLGDVECQLQAGEAIVISPGVSH